MTDCYSSPHFRANPGSRHGYDICDQGALNPELGMEDDYDAFCAALNAAGLGHIVDIVPNHMVSDPRSNPWWRDVLENGPSSPFAVFFDIDWDPVKPELHGKVLLPVLGDQYGRVLERGELHLRFENGALHLRYFELDLPINPRQSPRVLGLHLDRLEQDKWRESGWRGSRPTPCPSNATLTRLSVRSMAFSATQPAMTGCTNCSSTRRIVESSIFDFVQDVLLPAADAESPAPDPSLRDRLRFAMKMQQFSASVQAKGVEDTALYRYHALISANDVGGNPGRPAVAPEDFHSSNRKRPIDWPLELLATTTHDTKRGEDARARINVVSEIPHEWRKAVVEWMRINGRNRTRIDGTWAPDRNDEYLFYQALLGTWPAEEASMPVPERASQDLIGRLASYMAKAVHEAKVHTSGIHTNEEYDRAVEQFVSRTLMGRTAPRFLASFVPFQLSAFPRTRRPSARSN